ncbi:MAG: SOS response-associated peptidase family protein [Bacteroidota bacterium]|jgi:putative SOS response-associated peptidase YedK
MCGRFTQEQKSLGKAFNIEFKNLFKPKKEYNIGIGEFAVVQDKPGAWRQVKFGFNQQGKLHFNGRVEGFHNKNNALHYQGPFGIHTNPIYASIIQTSRCLIPVSSFIEGPEKERLAKPFKLHMPQVDAFMLAGVIGVDEKTGEEGFSILTCWPNEAICEKVGHHRSPVILAHTTGYETWLNEQAEMDTLFTLFHPVPSSDLHIEPISAKYRSAKFSEPYALHNTKPPHNGSTQLSLM